MLVAGHLRRPGWWSVPVWAISMTAVNVAVVWSLWQELEYVHAWFTPRDIEWMLRVGWERRSLWVFGDFMALTAVAYGLARLTARRDPNAPPKVTIRERVERWPTELRLWLALSVVWVLVLALASMIFDPLQLSRVSYWEDRHWIKFLTVLIGPVLVGLVALRLVHWATRDGKAK
jgi:hypothetical protein